MSKKPELSIVPSDATYLDRSDKASREAGMAEATLIIKAYEEAKESANGIAKGMVLTANHLREIGIRLKTWCGHEKLAFVFWKTRMEKLLPFDYEFAKFCISLSNQMEKKAAKLADAYPFAQMLLVELGFLDAPKREGKQNAITNKLQSLCCQIVEMKKPFQQILNSYKMEDWTRDDLELWLAEPATVRSAKTPAEQRGPVTAVPHDQRRGLRSGEAVASGYGGPRLAKGNIQHLE